MEKEEIINLIKGRIEDEYYKHPLIDLSTIAAIKIYNECFKYFNNQNQELQKDMADKWIKTSEKLPERLPNVRYSNPKVIVWYGEVAMLRFNHEHECWDDEDGDDYCCDIESVEYWMPLPNKPLNKQD